MALVSDFAVRGKVSEVKDAAVVFVPADTNYALHLQTASPYTGPLQQTISATIRAKAKKVYTVPSGGGFLSPLLGPPRTIQGRALHVENGWVVIRAGVSVVVELPTADDALDLQEGPIAVGSIINVVAEPGATMAVVRVGTRKSRLFIKD